MNTSSPQAVSPLMQAIQYNGGIYFTSHYFHVMYGNNGGEKYARLDHFNRLIRSIETYKNYLDSMDIIELSGKETAPELGAVCKATKRNPIMLINATAQVALTHHLDDAVSKQASVSVNTKAATGSEDKKLASLSDAILFADFCANHLRLSDSAKLRNAEAIANAYGLPLQLPVYTDEQLTRALGDLLKEHNIEITATKANIILEMYGMLEKKQRRSTGGKTKEFWSITESGLQYGKNETFPSSPSQTQPRWYADKFQGLLNAVNSFAIVEPVVKNALVSLNGGAK